MEVTVGRFHGCFWIKGMVPYTFVSFPEESEKRILRYRTREARLVLLPINNLRTFQVNQQVLRKGAVSPVSHNIYELDPECRNEVTHVSLNRNLAPQKGSRRL